MRLNFVILATVWLLGHAVGSNIVAVVTLVDKSNISKAATLFRSLWVSNNAVGSFSCSPLKSGATKCIVLLEAYACVANVSDSEFKQLQTSLDAVGAKAVHMNFHRGEGCHEHDVCKLQCAAIVAEKYNHLNIETNVLFVDQNLLIVGNVGISPIYTTPLVFHCHPSRVSNEVCSLNVFSFSAGLGPHLSAVLSASNTLLRNMTDLLSATSLLREVVSGFVFLESFHIVYAGQDWDTSTDISVDSVAFIEVDGIEHSTIIAPAECLMHLFVRWPNFQTVPVISHFINAVVYANDINARIMSGCDDHLILAKIEQQNKQFAEELEQMLTNLRIDSSPRKVFDLFLFNDEIELLQLRLQVLDGVVDHHVLIESNQTFTGKPKRLHYWENRHLFRQHSHRIIHVIVDNLPFPSPAERTQIWQNEYFSRSSGDLGLVSAGASDEDILLLADVDEIPYPEAVQRLRTLLSPGGRESYRYPHRRQVYKLYPFNFLYRWECFAGNGGALRGGALTATTWGTSKRIGLSSSSTLDPPNPAMHLHSTRHWLQTSNRPYPLGHVLYPGTLHLSFFGGLDRIRNKLVSYSHQNFASQYSSNASQVVSVSAEEISLDLVRSAVSAGVNINGNAETSTCQDIVLDEFASKVKSQWEAIVGRKPTREAKTLAGNKENLFVSPEQLLFDGFNFEILNRNVDFASSDTELKVAFVTGCIASSEDKIYIPHSVNHPAVSSFFITNIASIAEEAQRLGFVSIILAHIPVLEPSMENSITNAMNSKILKVFPQMFASSARGADFDFVIWMDNKFDLNWTNAWDTISHWPPQIAMMFPRPQVCCGVPKFFTTAMGQERYARGREQLERYIQEQRNLGFKEEPLNPLNNDASNQSSASFEIDNEDYSFASGFYIASLKHPDTTKIQNLWYQHINEAGIQCQISLYFVVQRFINSVGVYRPVWFTKGRIVFHESYEAAMRFVGKWNESTQLVTADKQ